MYHSEIVNDIMRQRVKDYQRQAAADRRAARAAKNGKKAR